MNFVYLMNFSRQNKCPYSIMCNVTTYRTRIFVLERWMLLWILPRAFTNLSMAFCQGQQACIYRPYFIKFTAKL